MELRFYNTLTKKKELFRPLKPGQVTMYTCGPTVYDFVHIGNLRSYVMADTLRRTLETAGLTVTQVKNITDVGHLTADDLAQGDAGEDKIEKKAKAEGKTPAEIARFYADYFFRTESALNILPAHAFPRATESIAGMIALIEKLIAKGHAYVANGNVFYDVTSFADYGKLSGNTLEKLKVGARLEEHPDKRHPWDFALWLKAPEGHLMRWDSPWSIGYPGWHIECSAMSEAALGEEFDIHTGGEDNIFPHHEAEIAQSEGAHEKPFVHYWLHARHLLVNGEKMSKSKGNFYKLEDILERGYVPMDLRMLFLGAHYRSQMNFTWEALEQAKKNKEGLFNLSERLASVTSESGFEGEERLAAIEAAMADDLNTPLAMSEALDLVRATNVTLDRGETANAPVLQQNLGKIFFLFGLKKETLEIPEVVQKLATERAMARKDKNFARSDALRTDIEKLGWSVEDMADGQRLKRR